MTPANIDVIDKIIEAVYNKYEVILTRVDVLIIPYQEIRDHKFNPKNFKTTYQITIKVGGKDCNVSIIKGDNIDAEIDRQVKNQL